MLERILWPLRPYATKDGCLYPNRTLCDQEGVLAKV